MRPIVTVLEMDEAHVTFPPEEITPSQKVTFDPIAVVHRWRHNG